MNAVVTGAGRGLGLEFVRQLLPAATTLIGTVRNAGSAKQLQEIAERNSEKLHVVTLDVSDETSIGTAAKQIAELTPAQPADQQRGHLPRQAGSG